MTQTHFRKIWRDLLSRKGRTWLVASAIFVGVAGTVILFSMSDLILEQLRDTLDPQEIAMVNVLVTVNTLVPLDNTHYLEILQANLDDLTILQASTQGTLTFKLSLESERRYEANMLSYSEPLDALTIEPIKSVEGEYPQRGQRELMVERRFAARYGLVEGDVLWVELVKSSPNLSNTPPQISYEAWKITGLAYHPYVLSPADTVYGHVQDNNYLTNTRGYNIWSARFRNYGLAHRQARDFTNLIATRTPYLPVYTQRQDPDFNPLIVGGERLSATLRALALLALFVSAFLVINVISAIVTEQKRQIGAMKALGASQLDIIFIYCGLALAYGALGVVPGIVLGIPLSYILAQQLAAEVNTILGDFHLSLEAILLGAMVGLGLPVLAALPPVLAGTRISILEAMSDSGINASYRAGLVDYFGALPLGIKQSIRNLSLKRGRIALTTLTLAIAVGAFMAVYSLFGAVKDELRLFLDDTSGNLIINADLQNNPELVLTTLKDYFENNPSALESLSQGFQLPVILEGYENTWLPWSNEWTEITAYGYDGNQLPLNLSLTAGQPPQGQNLEVLISQRLADLADVEVGDSLSISALGNSSSVLVSGITPSPWLQIWMPATTMLELAGYTEFIPTLEQYLGTAQLNNKEVSVLGVSAALNKRFEDIPYPDLGEVWISQNIAQQSGYQVGESLSLQVGNSQQNYQIAGIYDSTADLVALNWQDLALLEEREFGNLPQAYFIDNPNWEELLLDQLQNTLLQRAGIPTTLFNFVGLLEALNNNLNVFQALLSFVAWLIGVVGGMGLLLTLSMSVHERQREIGVMRSVGADSLTIARQFIFEGLAVGIIAWALGLPISFLLAQILLNVTGLDNTLPNARFSVDAALLGLLGMVILTTLASFAPAWRAANRTVSDILRYQ